MAVFARDSQISTFLHHCKVTDSDVRDLSFWVGLGTFGASFGAPPQNAGFL
jgi:hypothetical protein